MEMLQLIKKLKRAGFILALLLICPMVMGQSAEEMFQDYKKWGLVANRSIYYAKNEPNSVDFRIFNHKITSLGLAWNFHQKNNSNFKITVIKHLANWEDEYLRVKAEDIPLPEDAYDYQSILGIRSTNSQWKVNLLYEHFYQLKPGFYLATAIGPEVLYYPEIRERGATGVGTLDNDEIIVRHTSQTERVKDFNFGIKGELSAYIPLKIGLFQFKMDGFLAFNDYQVTDSQAFNLAVSPDSNSKHIIKGHYIGFGIGYYFNKGKRKKKKDEENTEVLEQL